MRQRSNQARRSRVAAVERAGEQASARDNALAILADVELDGVFDEAREFEATQKSHEAQITGINVVNTTTADTGFTDLTQQLAEARTSFVSFAAKEYGRPRVAGCVDALAHAIESHDVAQMQRAFELIPLWEAALKKSGASFATEAEALAVGEKTGTFTPSTGITENTDFDIREPTFVDRALNEEDQSPIDFQKELERVNEQVSVALQLFTKLKSELESMLAELRLIPGQHASLSKQTGQNDAITQLEKRFRDLRAEIETAIDEALLGDLRGEQQYENAKALFQSDENTLDIRVALDNGHLFEWTDEDYFRDFEAQREMLLTRINQTLSRGSSAYAAEKALFAREFGELEGKIEFVEDDRLSECKLHAVTETPEFLQALRVARSAPEQAFQKRYGDDASTWEEQFNRDRETFEDHLDTMRRDELSQMAEEYGMLNGVGGYVNGDKDFFKKTEENLLTQRISSELAKEIGVESLEKAQNEQLRSAFLRTIDTGYLQDLVGQRVAHLRLIRQAKPEEDVSEEFARVGDEMKKYVSVRNQALSEACRTRGIEVEQELRENLEREALLLLEAELDYCPVSEFYGDLVKTTEKILHPAYVKTAKGNFDIIVRETVNSQIDEERQSDDRKTALDAIVRQFYTIFGEPIL